VETVFHVPENAGEYEFSVDGTLLSLAETRQLLEREDDRREASRRSNPKADPASVPPSDRAAAH
jgi:hypothetical protein